MAISIDKKRVSLNKKDAYNIAVKLFEEDLDATYYVVTPEDLDIDPADFKFQSVKSTLTTYAATRTQGLVVHSGTDDDTDERKVLLLPADYDERVERLTEEAEAADES